MSNKKLKLSKKTLLEIEEARENIKKNKFYTETEAKEILIGLDNIKKGKVSSIEKVAKELGIVLN